MGGGERAGGGGAAGGRGAARSPRRCPCEAARGAAAAGERCLGAAPRRAEERAPPPGTIKRKAMEELSTDEASARGRGLRGGWAPGEGARGRAGPCSDPGGLTNRSWKALPLPGVSAPCFSLSFCPQAVPDLRPPARPWGWVAALLVNCLLSASIC